jgi:hypothetical protein
VDEQKPEAIQWSKSSVSGILSRKRYFTLQQIHNLHRHLGLPLEIFIKKRCKPHKRKGKIKGRGKDSLLFSFQ